jgi:hypothetical protein
MVALFVGRPTRWALWLGVPLFVVTALVWLAYWWLWGRSFERVDAGEDPVAAIEMAANVAMWTCAAGCSALAATASAAFWSARPARGSRAGVSPLH